MYNVYGKSLSVVALVIAISTIMLTQPLPMHVANALTKSSGEYTHQHITARYGETAVCGDHLCAPGEWDKLQTSLTAAQLGHQGGGNATQTTTAPSTTTPSGSMPPVPASVCESIKNILSGAGVSSSTVTKVMADLGCR